MFTVAGPQQCVARNAKITTGDLLQSFKSANLLEKLKSLPKKMLQGAKRVMCIQALKGKKGARLGDTIVASVKEVQPGGKVKKAQVVYGVVVRAAMQKGQFDGSEVKFDDNA
ncbi:50S ribosomal protein HLP, mitochondrial-like protein, partial [Tanacetum coccineum]